MDQNLFLAFGITILAGLATGIGSLLILLVKKTNPKFLSASLGFSAGVMIYVSFMEMMVESQNTLIAELGKLHGTAVSIMSFFGGIFIIAIIDKLVPDFENPHTMHSSEELLSLNEVDDKSKVEGKNLFRMGIMSAVAIAIHNFPEGVATFTAAAKDPSVGIPVAIAIAIHNIPEGIAVSVPIFYATGNRGKAFCYSFLSGLSEPLGAFVGYMLISRFSNSNMTFGILFAMVAGIMVYISLDELLPASEKYGEHHISIYGLISGMAVMATSLVLFDIW